MRERGADAREQQQPGEYAPEISAPAGNRHAAHNHRRDDFQFQAGAGLRINLRRLHGVHHRGQADQRADENKNKKCREARTDSREPRGFRVRTDGINKSAAGNFFHRQCE